MTDVTTTKDKNLFTQRKRLMQTMLLLITLAVGILAFEVMLRLTWNNPKAERPVGEDYALHVRLQRPNQSILNDLTGLYAGAGKVAFRTDSNGAVIGPRHPGAPLVHFYGGSTTENGVVPEGSRWVDLINGVDARNFGLAHNNMMNNYANFRYNLDNLPHPTEAFFMEAANDLIFSAMTTDDLNGKPARQPSKIRIYIYDFIRDIYNNISVSSKPLRDYWREDPMLKAQSQRSWLSEAEFETYRTTVLEPSLKRREDLIRNIVGLAKQHQVHPVFLTQPHNYTPNYKAYEGVDLRTYPLLNGKMFTKEQSAMLITMTNASTIATATAEGAEVIDVAKAFESQDPSPLFYDSFHYTAAGARFFASVVNAARQEK